MPNPQFKQRQQCLKNRKLITPIQQSYNSLQVTKKIIRCNIFKQAQHIALYLPTDNEMKTNLLIKYLWLQNKQVYLPKIYNYNIIKFVKYTPTTLLKKNQFNILEPFNNNTIATKKLDLIIMPLSCFDAKGNRIGMGGGFYDRALKFKQKNNKAKPFLMGLAHECQKVVAIKANTYDIKMNALATQTNLYRFSLF